MSHDGGTTEGAGRRREGTERKRLGRKACMHPAGWYTEDNGNTTNKKYVGETG